MNELIPDMEGNYRTGGRVPFRFIIDSKTQPLNETEQYRRGATQLNWIMGSSPDTTIDQDVLVRHVAKEFSREKQNALTRWKSRFELCQARNKGGHFAHKIHEFWAL